MVEGKIGKSLKKVLKKVVAKEAHEQLAISDLKLGGVIKVSQIKKLSFWETFFANIFLLLQGKVSGRLSPQVCSHLLSSAIKNGCHLVHSPKVSYRSPSEPIFHSALQTVAFVSNPFVSSRKR